MKCQRKFAYPVFVFAALFLLVALEAAIDVENHTAMTGSGAFWVVSHTGLSCLLVASLACAFGRFAKVVHVCVFAVVAYAFLGDLCEFYVRRHFPDETFLHGTVWISVLWNSSWGEVCEFLSRNVGWGEWIGLALFFPLVAAGMAILVRFPVARPDIRSLLVCLGCCVLFSVCTCSFPPHEDLLAQCLFDSGFVDFGFKDVDFDAMMDVGREVPPNGMFVAECERESQPFGLVVFGESATRRHWGLYGYSRDTTPRMSALSDELIVFSSVRASYWLTLQAMVCMLTGEDVENAPGRFALPSIVKSVGLASSFVSGQNHWGHVDGADVLFYRHSVRRTFLADYAAYGAYWDGDMIGLLRPDFAATSGVDVCFAHFMGSHFEYAKRCPAGFSRFPPDLSDDVSKAHPNRASEIVAYDNSIAYTDSVVADMIEYVRTSRTCSFVLYVSDHGESPESIDRDITQECLWEVPLVIWLSDGYRARFPDVVAAIESRKDKPMTNSAVFGLVLELLRIHAVDEGQGNGGN